MLTLCSLVAPHLMHVILFVTRMVTHGKKIRTEVEAICALRKTHPNVRFLSCVLHPHYKVAG